MRKIKKLKGNPQIFGSRTLTERQRALARKMGQNPRLYFNEATGETTLYTGLLKEKKDKDKQ